MSATVSEHGAAARTLLQMLLDEPARFGFDAAVTVLTLAAGGGRVVDAEEGDTVRFRATVGLGFVPAEVTRAERDGAVFRITTGILGLTGPSGVLPRPYTDLVNTEQRRRSPALAGFLDLLAQRPIAQYAEAGVKYRPHRAAQAGKRDGLRHMALALTGYGTPHLAPRLQVGTDPLLYFAGLFAARPRSVEGLSALVTGWLALPVEVEQFAGVWLSLGKAEMSTLPRGNRPGRFNALGVDAAIGSRSWDVQSRIRLRIGPLPLDSFSALLPGGSLFDRLASLVRAFLDSEITFAINPILAAAAVPAVVLQAGASPRLGWNSWLPTHGPRRKDAADAVFEPSAPGAGAAMS
jgi:type VI secretion system protein ImpH